MSNVAETIASLTVALTNPDLSIADRESLTNSINILSSLITPKKRERPEFASPEPAEKRARLEPASEPDAPVSPKVESEEKSDNPDEDSDSDPDEAGDDMAGVPIPCQNYAELGDLDRDAEDFLAGRTLTKGVNYFEGKAKVDLPLLTGPTSIRRRELFAEVQRLFNEEDGTFKFDDTYSTLTVTGSAKIKADHFKTILFGIFGPKGINGTISVGKVKDKLWMENFGTAIKKADHSKRNEAMAEAKAKALKGVREKYYKVGDIVTSSKGRFYPYLVTGHVGKSSIKVRKLVPWEHESGLRSDESNGFRLVYKKREGVEFAEGSKDVVLTFRHVGKSLFYSDGQRDKWVTPNWVFAGPDFHVRAWKRNTHVVTHSFYEGEGTWH